MNECREELIEMLKFLYLNESVSCLIIIIK